MELVQKGRQNTRADHEIFYKKGFEYGKSFATAGLLIPVAAKNPVASSDQLRLAITIKIAMEDEKTLLAAMRTRLDAKIRVNPVELIFCTIIRFDVCTASI